MENVIVTNWEVVDKNNYYLTTDWAQNCEPNQLKKAKKLAKEGKLYKAYEVSAVKYCIDNSKTIKSNLNKKEKLLILDKYISIRNAVWDFLELKGEVNSLRLANLVKKMAEAEGTSLFRNNEPTLFKEKETLPLLTQDNALLKISHPKQDNARKPRFCGS